MKRYSVSKATTSKWQRREEDTKTRKTARIGRTPCTPTLSVAQESIIVEFSRLLELPLDDLLIVTRRFINPDVSRSGLNRLLQREGLGSLRAARAKAAEEKDLLPRRKASRNTRRGSSTSTSSICPECPTKHPGAPFLSPSAAPAAQVFLHIHNDQSEEMQPGFPQTPASGLPDSHSHDPDGQRRAIYRLLHFPAKTALRQSSLRPSQCQRPHRPSPYPLIPPRHPQTNGMVERFNGRISELCQQTRFGSAAELEQTLMDDLLAYNHFIPQQAIGHRSPIDALASWYDQHPELFIAPVMIQDHNHAKLDILAVLNDCGQPLTFTIAVLSDAATRPPACCCPIFLPPADNY